MESALEINRRWREQNGPHLAAYNRQWYERNLTYIRKRWRKWYEANKDADRARVEAWRKANPEKVAEIRRRRRARESDVAVVPFTAEELRARLSMFAGCWMCGGPADSVDHVKPIASGGAHILANLRPACRPCNASKGASWPFPT